MHQNPKATTNLAPCLTAGCCHLGEFNVVITQPFVFYCGSFRTTDATVCRNVAMVANAVSSKKNKYRRPKMIAHQLSRPRDIKLVLQVSNRTTVNPLMGTLKPQRNGPLAIQWLVYWPLMGGLLQLVQRRGDWADCCTKCNSPSINGQYTNFILFDMELNYLCTWKG